MIQGIINRMAHCSFLLKGWSVVLISGIFALSAKEAIQSFGVLAYLPIISFWILDGYYLYQERLYRLLYSKVRKKNKDKIDFDMNTSMFEGQKNVNWSSSLFSKTIILFYGFLFVTVFTVMIIGILIQRGPNG